ncbi:MAG: CBS domain-containing protein [Bacteroidetes bacterium]|jgi:CBS domain-containing protein|nr:CBS domain-containing protein [Bacteroidota bacterium]|tara:strand:- start:447 stop:1109 length:663 start_codon:yes stop_codon:yes gene_type:complete
MIASRLIQEEIMPLNITDTANEALNRMNEYKVSHFPVADNGHFVGVISEKDIYNHENLTRELQKEFIHFDNFYVNEDQYILDVLKLISDQKLSLVPVIDDKGNYIGCITQSDLISFFAESMSVDYPGGVIVLEVSVNDYSLTEIANIVESNDAKVLSSYILSKVNSTKLEVIIKVSKLELGSILQTFERFGYQVNASFEEDVDLDELKDNYDSLINYLNI